MLWLFFLLIAIVFMSVNTLLVKTLVKEVTPELILFYQYLVGIPLVLAYSLFSGVSITMINYFIILLGVVYFLGIAALYLALKKGPLSKVSPVFNSKLLVTALLGLIFLLEPFSTRLVIGLLFGLLGVCLLGGESS